MASLPIRFRPAAADELADAIEWYGQQSEKAANDLRDAIRAKLAEAARSLARWPLQRDGTRQIYVGSFPYLLIVREIKNTLEVIAVAHTSRRPGYWRKRLRDQ